MRLQILLYEATQEAFRIKGILLDFKVTVFVYMLEIKGNCFTEVCTKFKSG